ncbi:ribbon-helix-helix protein, CopG family [Bifidobacterium simiarum]|nr:ribbon-helix-helix protein, CopG family [Bifidobacterium simiarum]MBT1166338.1 ribbon-helix-helix protein, CopG family [Bifidobacterium simiarum]
MKKPHYNYVIVGDDYFSEEENKMLNEAAEEAERGYSLEFLNKCRPGRPLKIGRTPARHKVQVRLDNARLELVDGYARKLGVSRSEAIRALLDKALASA